MHPLRNTCHLESSLCNGCVQRIELFRALTFRLFSMWVTYGECFVGSCLLVILYAAEIPLSCFTTCSTRSSESANSALENGRLLFHHLTATLACCADASNRSFERDG